MQAFSKVFSVIVGVTIILILIILSGAERQDVLAQVVVQKATDNFVNKLQVMGYINEELYMELVNDLDVTNNLYTITIEHSHVITEPEVDDAGVVTGYYEYTESYYEDEITEAIFQKNGVYQMAQGDYISVTVKNRTNTFFDNVKRMIFGSKWNEFSIFGTAGGRIRDVAY